MDAAERAVVDRIRAAIADEEVLRIRSGGTKDFYGNVPDGSILDPRDVCGIVAYDAAELVLVARCGTPLAEIESTLEASGQMLAFEPPHFGSDATIGGCVAAGLAGPRRMSHGYTHGSVRDFVLGAKCIDGRGQSLAFGGTVMKNVAGYDVSRLLAGSLGILGVITQIALKIVPRPMAERTLVFQFDETKALAHLTRWYAEPLPVSGSVWCGGQLFLRLAGAEAAVVEGANMLGGYSVEPAFANSFWLSVRNQSHEFFAGYEALWRLALPSGGKPLSLGSDSFIEWGGALRWIRNPPDPEQIRATVAARGGHTTLFRHGDRRSGVFTALTPALARLHQRLCDQFDPHRVFDRGRLLQE